MPYDDYEGNDDGPCDCEDCRREATPDVTKDPIPSYLVTTLRDSAWKGTLPFISTPEEQLVAEVSGTPLLYLGTELELSFGNTSFNYNEVKAFGDRHWFVNRGYRDVDIEFPFRPITMGAFRAAKDEIAQFLKELRDMSARAYEGELCGQHIHLSKNAFVGDHLYRFLDLVYRNHQFSERLSQRTRSQMSMWCEFDGVTTRSYGNNLDEYLKRKSEGLSSGAVRVNEDTVELRLPRGSVRLDRFYKNLEWAQSAFEFSREAGYSERNPDAYYEWLKARDTFPNLVDFIEEKRLVAAARPSVAV